jgi:hypothetical protein
MSEKIYYKIRHRVTGNFSKGSSYSNATGDNSFWNKSGKTWDTLGKLRAHITQHLRKVGYGGFVINEGTDMSDWEVIEYKVIESDVKRIDEVIDPKKLIQLLQQ